MNAPELVNLPGIARDIVSAGLLTPARCHQLLQQAQDHSRTFVREIIETASVPEGALMQCLSTSFMLPALDFEALDPVRFPPERVPFRLMYRHLAVPVRVQRGNVLILACADPSDEQMLKAVQFATQLKLNLVLIEALKVRHFLEDMRKTKGLQAVDMDDDSGAAGGKALEFWGFEAPSSSAQKAAARAAQDSHSGDLNLDDLLGQLSKDN